MGTLTMSEQERKRVGIMVSVKAGELSLTEASAVLGLGYRQTKRIWRRYQDHGDAGLVHRLRGQPGQRRKPPELRAKILAPLCGAVSRLWADAGGGVFGEGKAPVDHETLRRWLPWRRTNGPCAGAPTSPAMA